MANRETGQHQQGSALTLLLLKVTTKLRKIVSDTFYTLYVNLFCLGFWFMHHYGNLLLFLLHIFLQALWQ